MSRPSRFYVEYESTAAVREAHELGVKSGDHEGPLADCLGCADSYDPSLFTRIRNFEHIETAVRYAAACVNGGTGCLVSIYERADLRPDEYAPGLWEWEDKAVASEPFADPGAIVALVTMGAA